MVIMDTLNTNSDSKRSSSSSRGGNSCSIGLVAVAAAVVVVVVVVVSAASNTLFKQNLVTKQKFGDNWTHISVSTAYLTAVITDY